MIQLYKWTRLFKGIIFKFWKQPPMRIEKDPSKHTLAFSGHEYQAIPEETNEPYDFSQVQTDSTDITVRVAEGSDSNDLGTDCSDFNLNYFQLSEEQEMLLDFLLPGRQAKRERCLKSVSYIEFISNSIIEYENSLIDKRKKETAGGR